MSIRHATVLVLCCLALMVGCKPNDPQVIDPKDLQAIRLDEVVRVQGLLKRPAEAVCVLTPYVARLDETEPLSRQVNAHLAAIDYFGADDSAQAFVFVNGDTVTVQRVNATGVDLGAWHEGVLRVIKPVQCTAVAQAVLMKVDPFVPTLILGEAR